MIKNENRRSLQENQGNRSHRQSEPRRRRKNRQLKQASRFFDHLLTSFATHSLIDVTAKVKGDLKHHSIEDLAIGLGEALSKALGNREGITRFGYATVPMDDSLASAAVDLVKRPYAVINLKLRGKKVEDMATEDIVHFFETLATSLVREHSRLDASTAATTTTKQKPQSKP